jgi:Rrf2 family protein
MKKFLGFSEAFILAVHSVVLMAAKGDGLTAGDIAQKLGVSEAHLHKVLATLGRAGVLRSSRGPGGGYSLAREPGEITLWEVYTSIEGKPGEDNCLLRPGRCIGKSCLFSGLLEETAGRIREFLTSTTLATAAESYTGKGGYPAGPLAGTKKERTGNERTRETPGRR